MRKKCKLIAVGTVVEYFTLTRSKNLAIIVRASGCCGYTIITFNGQRIRISSQRISKIIAINMHNYLHRMFILQGKHYEVP